MLLWGMKELGLVPSNNARCGMSTGRLEADGHVHAWASCLAGTDCRVVICRFVVEVAFLILQAHSFRVVKQERQ
jgi:hypothetical protein